MSLVFLVCFLLVLVIIVEISAIALKLTGMELHVARFQALSALVTVGYTTSDSEEVVKHHVRRRIIMVLMVLGYLGTATIVTALINIMRHPLTLLQVGTALVIVLLAFSLVSSRRLRVHLDRGIERQLSRHRLLQKKSVEEVLKLDRHYGVAEVRLQAGSHLVGQTIAASKIRDQDIFILAIERSDAFIHSPRGSQVLQAGDKLIVYGNMQNIHLLLCSDCYR
ncbi:TrkA C-terminal domain-containing protein [Desulforamulus hydrothermalis]|uniref:TrkA-C domain protein n=1 Tax=Desulforamulus hydrothermalis Lam5 = DSM 18033 TaxID=1121428 RepID=K8E0V7_9FIRM|nr:TrkA C-terminal domain-containing protein [Desulforamulus hydrothermalis]CCO09277.1 TrkA-C domain protein [Desulforamulus hydrothermalis Lam5 = DSM 18033]SHH05093.1 TrkA-C domain-containing protein [Desulforamulus hydrothermalis Lam5 = DSM 18033]